MYIHTATAPAAKPLPRVRVATTDDLEEILSMCRDLHAENGLMSLDEGKVQQAVIDSLTGRDGIFGVVGRNPVEGMIMLGLRQYWYAKDGDVHLEEMLNYVREPFRRSRNAIALIEFAKTTALKLGVPLLIGIVSNTRTEQKIKLYQRRLGKPAGGYFLWNGRTGHAA